MVIPPNREWAFHVHLTAKSAKSNDYSHCYIKKILLDAEYEDMLENRYLQTVEITFCIGKSFISALDIDITSPVVIETNQSEIKLLKSPKRIHFRKPLTTTVKP